MTSPIYENGTVTVYQGDCLDVLRAMPDASVHAIITDPPYGLEFMGKDWDSFAPERTRYHGERANTSRNIGDDVTRPSSRHRVSYAMTRPTFRRCTVCGRREFSGSPCQCDTPQWKYEQPEGTPTRMAAFQTWCTEWARECLRVLTPGGHLLAFGGTRTWHRLACAIEDAGFEVRDTLSWLYGSGFPKSLDVSKAIDKARDDRADIVRVTGWLAQQRDRAGLTNRDIDAAFGTNGMAGHWTSVKSQPAVPTWEQWCKLCELIGFGSEMDAEVRRLNTRKGSPGEAWEQREVIGTREVSRGRPGLNGPTHGGDSSRELVPVTASATDHAHRWEGWGTALKPAHEPIVVARKPLAGTVAATVLEHGTGGLNIDACRIPTTDRWAATGTRSAPGTALSGSADGTLNVSVSSTHEGGRWPSNVVFTHAPDCGDHCTEGCPVSTLDTQSSNTSRFFPVFRYQAKAPKSERPRVNGIAHPTVKPLALMRWLIRLVTPPDGIVLDPFAGSGTTLQAARDEGFHAVGIERETDYIELIRARLNTNAEPDTEKHEPANEGKPESTGEIPGQVSLYDVLNEEGAA